MKKLSFTSFAVILFAGCVNLASCVPALTLSATELTPTQLFISIDTQTAQPIISPSPTQSPSSSTTPTQISSSPEASSGCRQPSDDYAIITINDHLLNQRTYDMLVYADHLYQGVIDITNTAITQGSYTDAVPESFHTHAAGGAVDISVIALGTYDILYDEIDPLIHAMRLAGFAAWFRDFNDIYEGSPVHIHAIAIGDRDLSLVAREQLAGPFGYFWGYDGLPQEDGVPNRDPYGGPIVCDWMIEMGYPNKTATPSP